MADITTMTAVDAARNVRSGKIKSEDLVRAYIDQIENREHDVCAWAYIDPQIAIAQARDIDRIGHKGLLSGIPIGVKDVIDASGMPTACNSPIYSGHHPIADAACVAMARRAGAIIMGKTVTTEFAFRMPGPTRNPHNLSHSPGGSSSGSAAAVADAMVPLAFGTQTAGSTIRPGAYCGIVAYKPSYGTINCAGLKHLAESLDTIGVFGRTVEDCALLAHVTSSRRLPAFKALPPHTLRIGLCRTSHWSEADRSTQLLLEEMACTLTNRGAAVTELVLPNDFAQLYDDQILIMKFEAARALAWEYMHYPDKLSAFMRDAVAEGFETPRLAYEQAVHHSLEFRCRFKEIMNSLDVIITPSAAGEAPQGIENTGNSLFNRNWTLLGVPCITIPAGYGPNGLPLGVQIVGAFDADELVLTCADWVEKQISLKK